MEENHVNGQIPLIVIGGSAGSLDGVVKIFREVTTRKFAFIVVLHRKGSAESFLVDILSGKSILNIKEAEEKESIQAGTVYIAPPDYHLLIEKDRTLSLDDSEKINFSRPSIDVTFESAAEIFGSAVVGIILSGGNDDGVSGLKCIRANGGLCIVQDPSSAEVSFMPQHAISEVQPDSILDVEGIVGFINQL